MRDTAHRSALSRGGLSRELALFAQGARVKVWNTQGEVEALCRLSANVRPGVAWMPYGGMFDAGGKQRSVNVLTDEAPTDWGGGSGLYDAFVEVALLAA